MRTLPLLVLLLVVGLAGCADTQPAAVPPLTATLLSPTDIRLDWRAAPPGALGQVVEYINQPTEKFTVLAFLPATETSYTHPRLIPKTTFYYRVHALFGQQTPPVPVTLAANAPAPTDGTGPRRAPHPARRPITTRCAVPTVGPATCGRTRPACT
jgi:hypothetical protein